MATISETATTAANSTIPQILFGHEQAVATFRKAWQSGRLHHSWMLTGPEGIGKTSLAFHLAAFVLSDGKAMPGRLDSADHTTRLILAESHPDLCVLRRPRDDKTGQYKEQITVEIARALPNFLSLTPSLGRWRVVIIEDAWRLNNAAQNAILKSIEEPPSNSLVLMCVTSTGRVLPTIRSRCRVMRMRPLNTMALRSALEQALGVGSYDLPEIVCHQGNVGLVLALHKHEGLIDLHNKTLSLLNPTKSVQDLHALAGKVARKGEENLFPLLVDLLIATLSRALRHITRGNDAKSFGIGGALPDLISVANVGEKLLDVIDIISDIKEITIRGSLDQKVAFVRMVEDVRASLALASG